MGLSFGAMGLRGDSANMGRLVRGALGGGGQTVVSLKIFNCQYLDR